MIISWLFAAATAFAAPHPATGSSVLTDPAKGLFFHGFGFRLSTLGTPWTAAPSLEKETIFETVRFENRGAPGSAESSLSIRMDELPDKTNLESYARKWMRDYPSYGFEVLGTKNLNLGGGRALVVDLVQKNKNRQLRQVILQKDQQVAVVTCLDRKDRFADTLQSCNQILKSFEWSK
ncbi:MAG: hypothetical protein KF802_07295 [Bdellovibrionaceae bacterium]|nr:hypothetical protein [Pseudobdellovibrionaceae bacterium]MBX3033024.1 hypothetical protein [Pseudobdellovibrionaceae bacterium]